MMSDPMVRGYCIERVYGFIESYFDPDTTARLLNEVPQETRALRSELKPAVWYPRRHQVDLHRVIAGAGGSADDTFKMFQQCGNYMSIEATNTYLRVLLKLLTPGLFAKKLPSFWERDYRGGRLETDASKLSDDELIIRLVDVEGFDHCAAVSAGFIRYVLEAMGKKNLDVQPSGWSLDEPGPASVELMVRWS